MKKRRCKNKNCRCLFVVSRRHPKQKYCSRKKCQNARKAQWERKKLAHEKDYRMNKANSQERWATKKPWYWKKYRENNPEYTKRNREKQKARDQLKRDLKADASILKNLAKMDASNAEIAMLSGIYTLIPVKKNNLAKMDALTVKIERISTGYG